MVTWWHGGALGIGGEGGSFVKNWRWIHEKMGFDMSKIEIQVLSGDSGINAIRQTGKVTFFSQSLWFLVAGGLVQLASGLVRGQEEWCCSHQQIGCPGYVYHGANAQKKVVVTWSWSTASPSELLVDVLLGRTLIFNNVHIYIYIYIHTYIHTYKYIYIYYIWLSPWMSTIIMMLRPSDSKVTHKFVAGGSVDPCQDTAGHRQAGTAGRQDTTWSIITTTVTRWSHLKVRNAEVLGLHLARMIGWFLHARFESDAVGSDSDGFCCFWWKNSFWRKWWQFPVCCFIWFQPVFIGNSALIRTDRRKLLIPGQWCLPNAAPVCRWAVPTYYNPIDMGVSINGWYPKMDGL